LLKVVDLNFYKDLDQQAMKTFVDGCQKGKKNFDDESNQFRNSIDPIL